MSVTDVVTGLSGNINIINKKETNDRQRSDKNIQGLKEIV
jgi:hypothetical protein